MLKRVQKHPWLLYAIIAGLIIALFFGSFFVDVVREICEKDEYASKPDCYQYHLGPWAALRIGQIVDAHNGFVTAIATIIMAAFTGTLWLTSKRQGHLAQESIDLARDEFNATHRPQIVIHSVKFEPIVSKSGDSDLSKAAATVTFYNTGLSPAFIEGIKYSIAQRRLPLESSIFPNTEIPLKRKEIARGVGDYIELGSDIEMRMERLGHDSASRLILIGKIFYRDGANGLRQTGFCRALGGSPQRRTWDRIDDPEYEYGY